MMIQVLEKFLPATQPLLDKRTGLTINK